MDRYVFVRLPWWGEAVVLAAAFALLTYLIVGRDQWFWLPVSLVLGALLTLLDRARQRRHFRPADGPWPGDRRAAVHRHLDTGTWPADPALRRAVHAVATERTSPGNAPWLIVIPFVLMLGINGAAVLRGLPGVSRVLVTLIAVSGSYLVVRTVRQRRAARALLAAG